MKNKKKMIICICIIVLIPLVIRRLSIIPIFSSTSNDWVGFWGSYIGAIVGACVALYVLTETLNDNKKAQTKAEVVEFCNSITEKVSVFAQKYEESLYEAHTYLAVHELKTSLSEQEFGMYKQFISTHHSAKAMIYEIETYLSIRKDIDTFYTPKFEKALKAANVAYNEFKKFESKVGKAEKVTDVNDKDLIRVIEDFLDILNQYEKELLDKMTLENGRRMKTLKEIYNGTKERIGLKQKDYIVACYIEILKKEIGDNKARLMIYKEECQNKVDLNLPMFWMSALSATLTVLSVMIGIIVWKVKPEEITSIVVVFVCLIVILLGEVIFYQVVLREKKKYSLMALVLDSIELEMNKNSFAENSSSDTELLVKNEGCP